MPQDDEIKALERAAAETSPEVVRWVNALRRAGEKLPVPPQEVPASRRVRSDDVPEGLVDPATFYALAEVGRGLIAAALRPTNDTALTVAANNTVRMTDRCGILYCDERLTHHVTFEDATGPASVPSCGSHLRHIEDAIETCIPGNVTSRALAPLQRGDPLPSIIGNAFVYPQTGTPLPRCQFPISSEPGRYCGSVSGKHIETRPPRVCHIYTCALHLNRMLALLHHVQRQMIGAAGAGGWTVHER